MTTTTKTGIALIIVLAIIVLGWFIISGTQDVQNLPVTEQEQIPTPTPVAKLPNTAGTGMSDISDTSQQGIQTDVEAFDAQMKELNTETTNIDNGLKEVI